METEDFYNRSPETLARMGTALAGKKVLIGIGGLIKPTGTPLGDLFRVLLVNSVKLDPSSDRALAVIGTWDDARPGEPEAECSLDAIFGVLGPSLDE
jgi:hypothetical protein